MLKSWEFTRVWCRPRNKALNPPRDRKRVKVRESGCVLLKFLGKERRNR